MVDSRKYFGASFVTLNDVAEGPLKVRISSIAEGKYGKLDVTFDDGFVLSLNATNARTLAKAYGADTDAWIDHEIELYAGEIEYQGKSQPAVRVKPISAPVQASLPQPPAMKANARNADLDDDIPF